MDNNMNMSDIRESLKPKGTKNVVQLKFIGLGFFDANFVNECVDEMEHKLRTASLDAPSKLEILAMELLKDSAQSS